MTDTARHRREGGGIPQKPLDGAGASSSEALSLTNVPAAGWMRETGLLCGSFTWLFLDCGNEIL
jgi:hypothetical protein